MIDLTNHKDPVRVFNNACKPGANNQGDWIVYHQGYYSDGIGNTPIGQAAMEQFEAGRVHLVQKLLHTEPREYLYVGVVR